MARRDTTPRVRVTQENLVALPALAPYFAFGLLALAVSPWLVGFAAPALESGAYRHVHVLAALHGIALGWGTSIALGALQQMTAVVGATTLHSTRLALGAFIPFSSGVVGLIVGFYTMAPIAFAIGAVGVPTGTALVVYNVVRTAASAQPTRRWQIISPYVASAVVYVVLAFVAGGLLALNLTRGLLGTLWNDVFPFHITLAAGGWFFMLIVGISYHLLTFFGLTDKGADFKHPDTVRRLIHSGLIAGIASSVMGEVVGAGLGSFLRTLAMIALGAAGILFLWETRGVYVRPPRQIVAAVYYYIRAAHTYLGMAVALLLIWGLFPLALGARAYVAIGVLLGGGWLSNTILGYLHRILAFFVWHNKYWGRGREPGVPAFRDMVDSRLALLGLVLLNVGVLAFILALYTPISLLWGAGTWFLGTLTASINLIRTMLR